MLRLALHGPLKDWRLLPSLVQESLRRTHFCASWARRCPLHGPNFCPWCAKRAKIDRNECMFKFKWLSSSRIGINQAGLWMWGSFNVDILWKCENKGVLSANSLPHHCCCERGARVPWLSLIWALQLQPISAAAAGVHHFSLTPWLWPPPLYLLQNWSHPLTTPQGFTWPMEPFSTPRITHYPVNKTCPGAWHGASVLSVSFSNLLKSLWSFIGFLTIKTYEKSNLLGTLLLFSFVELRLFVNSEILNVMGVTIQ